MLPKASRPAPGGRIFMDVSTSLAWRGRHAVGIVRTEREILTRLLDDPELAVVPVVFHDGSFRAIDPQLARALAAPVASLPPDPTLPPVRPASTEASAPAPTPPAPGRPAGRRAGLIAPLARLMRAAARRFLRVLPQAAREDVRLALIHLRAAVRALIYPPAAPQPRAVADQPAAAEDAVDLSLVVHPGRNDVLFLCGLAWDVIDWTAVDALRARSGMRVVAVMYDLIPIKLPEVCHTSTNHPFLNCFLHILDNASLIFCISHCTKNDLLAFAAAMGRPRPQAEVIHLGADMPVAADPAELVRREVHERLCRRPFALAVGTFEVRKNYKLLLDVWQDLGRDPEFDLDLVIVGGRGWRADDEIRRIEEQGLFSRRVLWLQGLPDASLSWLYDACHLFVFPSLYEGWGLPVVEALQHGCPVIASDRGATPEAGFGLATLLDPDDRAAWREAIRAAAREPRRRLPVPPVPSWDDTAASVARGLQTVLPAVQGAA